MLREGDEPIPGYRLQKFLGRGQFGEVWKTTAPGGTSAALKFIDLKATQGNKELKGILRVKEIRHAHLMPITALWLLDGQGNVLSSGILESYDPGANTATTGTIIADSGPPAGLDANMLVVAMLLGDIGLDERLEECMANGEEGIPTDELLRYMEESAKGIDFLNTPQHNLGRGPVAIQHCDIKPANIMLVGGTAVICDFGLARMLGDMTNISATATSMSGSPAYMAPECVGKKTSSSTDQYALAITYYQLRTGLLPFEDQSYYAVLEAHQKGTLSLSKLSSAEQKVIRRATAVKPEDRYPSAVEMVKDLRRAIEGKPANVGGGLGNVALIGIVLIALVLGGVYLWDPSLFKQNTDPVTATAKKLVLEVSPENAEVRINNAIYELPADGTFKVQPESEVLISVSANGFDYSNKTIRYDDVKDGDVIQIALNSLDDLQATAKQMASNGDIAGATKILTEVLSLRPMTEPKPHKKILVKPQKNGDNKDIGENVYDVQFTPDGQDDVLVAAISDKRLLLFNPNNWDDDFKEITTSTIPDYVCWSNDGKWLALASTDDDSLQLFKRSANMLEKGPVLTFPVKGSAGYPIQLHGIANGFAAFRQFDSDEKILFDVWKWDLDQPQKPWNLTPLLNEKQKDSVESRALISAPESGDSVALLLKTQWLLANSATNQIKEMYRPAAGHLTVKAARFSPNGSRLAVATSEENNDFTQKSGRVILYETAAIDRGDQNALTYNASPATGIEAFTWISDDRFVTSTATQIVRVWSVDQTTNLAELKPATTGLSVRGLDSFAERFVVALAQSTVTIWDVSQANPKPLVMTVPSAQRMTISSDGKWLVVCDAKLGIHVWDLRWLQAIISASAQKV